MTILPKKKPGKEKADPETAEHCSHNHPHHHPSTSENRHEKTGRGRNSPTRWLPGATRDADKHQSHDPGGGFETHEAGTGHNKRRHRSSPHRNHARKHRGGHTPQTSPHVAQPDPKAEYEEAGYNSGDEYVPPTHPENIEELEKWFEEGLKEKRGLHIKKMGEDGACLFRAFADQVYGDQEMHGVVRRSIIDYMSKNSDYFSHYVTEDFTTYLNRKRMDNCHGNHLEMQAMCEIYNRPIEVFQYSLDPMNTFHCSYETDNEPIRISYHRNVHYNSLVDPYKQTIGVGLGLPHAKFQPRLSEKHLVHDATKQSEELHLEQAMLEDKIRETDWEVTQETIEEQVARESYLQWLRDNEKRVRRHDSPRTASATCSSSSEYAKLMETSASPESRSSRSPRSKSSCPNSAQNSPQRMDTTEQQGSSTHFVEQKSSSSVSPKPGLSQEPGVAVTKDLEVSQGATGGFDFETESMMNQFPESIYADLAQWNEEDLLAQVMAQSQKEYLDSLKKTVVVPGPAAPGHVAMPSSSSSHNSGSSNNSDRGVS